MSDFLTCYLTKHVKKCTCRVWRLHMINKENFDTNSDVFLSVVNETAVSINNMGGEWMWCFSPLVRQTPHIKYLDNK